MRQLAPTRLFTGYHLIQCFWLSNPQIRLIRVIVWHGALMRLNHSPIPLHHPEFVRIKIIICPAVDFLCARRL